jgi:hypothetical protein
MLVGIASNEISKVSTKNITAKITGSKTVQQKAISWSYLIRGNDALTHINMKTIKQVFKPNDTPKKTPPKIGLFNCPITQAKGYK